MFLQIYITRRTILYLCLCYASTGSMEVIQLQNKAALNHTFLVLVVRQQNKSEIVT